MLSPRQMLTDYGKNLVNLLSQACRVLLTRKQISKFFLFFFHQLLTTVVVRYLNERRLNGNEAQTQSHPVIQQQLHTPSQTRAVPSTASPASTSNKRSAPADQTSHGGQTKRPRGRPKGSKNRMKDGVNDTPGG